jgi:hypothetical protein
MKWVDVQAGKDHAYGQLIKAMAILRDAQLQATDDYGLGNPASSLLIDARDYLFKQANAVMRGELELQLEKTLDSLVNLGSAEAVQQFRDTLNRIVRDIDQTAAEMERDLEKD